MIDIIYDVLFILIGILIGNQVGFNNARSDIKVRFVYSPAELDKSVNHLVAIREREYLIGTVKAEYELEMITKEHAQEIMSELTRS